MGAFSIDFAAAYTVMAILFVCIFFSATNVVSTGLTAGYSDELGPMARQIGDSLLESPGEPEDWYAGPSNAVNATTIGLSVRGPNVISTYKLDGLRLYNAAGIKRALGLADSGDKYGLRIEISSRDDSMSWEAGYPLPPDTRDVYKSGRIALIYCQDGSYRPAGVTIYLWRKSVGTSA